MKSRILVGAFLALVFATEASAEAQLSGLLDVLFKNTGESELTNQSFGGVSTFDTIRLRLFADATVGDKISVFTQLFSSDDEIGVYGAYIRFEEVAGGPVGVQMGFIPGTVGTFAERTYSDKNPLVGTPLMYVHHSSFHPGDDLTSVEGLLAAQADRDRYGLPILYDNCWNSGLEAYASAGPFDFSLAAVVGSVSHPSRQQVKDVPQGTARIAWNGGPGFEFGVSGFYGPYLGPDEIVFPAGSNENDFMNQGVAADLAWITRWIDLRAEAIAAEWEYPAIPDLGVVSGYVEAMWKFRTRWFLAARGEAFEPSEVPDSTGQDVKWDDPVRRLEYGVGFRPRVRTTLKLVAQHNRFDVHSQYDADLYALQVGVAF